MIFGKIEVESKILKFFYYVHVHACTYMYTYVRTLICKYYCICVKYAKDSNKNKRLILKRPAKVNSFKGIWFKGWQDKNASNLKMVAPRADLKASGPHNWTLLNKSLLQ